MSVQHSKTSSAQPQQPQHSRSSSAGRKLGTPWLPSVHSSRMHPMHSSCWACGWWSGGTRPAAHGAALKTSALTGAHQQLSIWLPSTALCTVQLWCPNHPWQRHSAAENFNRRDEDSMGCCLNPLGIMTAVQDPGSRQIGHANERSLLSSD